MVSFPYYSHKNPWRGPWNQPWLFATIASWGPWQGRSNSITFFSFWSFFRSSSWLHTGFLHQRQHGQKVFDFVWSNEQISPQALLFDAGSTRLENPNILKIFQTKLYDVLSVVFSQYAVMSEFAQKFNMMAYVVRIPFLSQQTPWIKLFCVPTVFAMKLSGFIWLQYTTEKGVERIMFGPF